MVYNNVYKDEFKAIHPEFSQGVFIVDDAKSSINFENKIIPVNKGDLLVFSNNSNLKISSDIKFYSFVVYKKFDGKMMDILTSCYSKNIFENKPEKMEEIRQCFLSEIEENGFLKHKSEYFDYIKIISRFKEVIEWKKNGNLDSQTSILDLYSMVFSISNKNYIKSKALEKCNETFDTAVKIKKYIDENLDKNYNVQEIARKFGLNKNNINIIFKEVNKCNVKEYILREKIKKSSDLLLNTDIHIKDIAKFIGIVNINYFYRIFKKKTGYTPAEYKRKYIVS